MTHDASKNWLVNLLGVLLFLCAAAAVGIQAELLRSVPGDRIETSFGPHLGFLDFHDAVYFPERAFLTGGSPYSESYATDFHPDERDYRELTPTSLIVHLPFGWLNLRTSEWAYMALNLVLMLVISLLIFRFAQLPVNIGGVSMLAGMMVLCLPGLVNFYSLQMTPLLSLGCLLALEFGANRPVIAGLGGMLAMCNPLFGLPLVVYLLFRRNLQAVAVTVFLTLATSALALAIMNANAVASGDDPAEMLSHKYTNVEAIWHGWVHDPNPNRIDAWATVRSWTEDLGWEENASLIQTWLPVGCLAFAALCLFCERNSLQRQGVVSRTGVFVVLMILATVQHVNSDALLIWPVLAALFIGAPKLESAFPAFVRGILICLLLVPMFNFLGGEVLLDELPIEIGTWQWKLATSLNAIAVSSAAVIVGICMLFSRRD